MILSYNLKLAIKKYGFTLKELPKNAKHEAGKTYWCHYWGTWYNVLAVEGDTVKCEWEDGHINVHCTPLDKHDCEIIWEDGEVNQNVHIG